MAWLFISANSWWAFQSAGTGKYATPTKLLLCTLIGKLQIFPTAKTKTIGFLLDPTQQYAKILFNKFPLELLLSENKLQSEHWATYSEVACTCFPTQCMWLYLCALWKLLEQLAEWLLVLQTCVSHHASVQQDKDKTVRNTTSLNLSTDTVTAKVFKMHYKIPCSLQPASSSWCDNTLPRVNLGSVRKTAGHSP